MTKDAPWRTCRAQDDDAIAITRGEGALLLAEVYGPMRRERAALICRAVNCYPAFDDLVKALEQVEREMQAGFGSSFGDTREQVRRALAKAASLTAATAEAV